MAVGLAEQLDASEALAGQLFVDLARHALVAPALLERLAAGIDTTTPLQNALARIASRRGNPPTGRAADAAPTAPNLSPALDAAC